jgi:replicative DNA helicase
LPPQAIDIEEAVIGAMMVDSVCIDDIAEILTPEVFYKSAHQIIFSAALGLYKKNQYTDILSVTNRLQDTGELEIVGGPTVLLRLTSKVVTTAQAVQHSYILKAAYIQREMIRIGHELVQRGYDPTLDPSDLLEYAEKELYQLGDTANHKEAVSISALLNRLSTLIEKREKTKSDLLGVPSGIMPLDRITMGWQPGDLIIIAARPSMGKSALAVQFARFASQYNHPALVFSLEMTDLQLGERFLSSESGHDSYDLKRGRNVQWEKIERVISNNKNTPLWIDDSAHVSIYEFRSKVRRAKKRHKIELVICDYLNLFSGDEDKQNMSEKYGSISKMFKQVAKECKVAVIALAQLNRSPEMRLNAFPKLSDLRNSGEIEQDADIVIFPVQYRRIGMMTDENDRDLSGLARIDIAKNRNGVTDFIEVEVSPDSMIWKEIERESVSIDDFTEPNREKNNQLPF